MKFTLWDSLKSIENEYLHSLFKITDIFERIAKAANGNEVKFSDVMTRFQETEEYDRFILSAVKRMVLPLYRNNNKIWGEAAKQIDRGDRFYNLLMGELKQNPYFEDLIAQNVFLIKTLPTDVSKKVVEDIKINALKGLRSTSIEEIIKDKTRQYARSSARLIARTEVSKTQCALTQARAQRLNLNWYVWRTEMDGDRVRRSHRKMEGVLVNWNDPPSPEALVGEKNVGYYHAGNIWNCRCYPEPLLDIEDVSWNHNVYMDGKIQKMSKREFEKYY